MSWPRSAPSVATLDRLAAGTQAEPVVLLRRATRASSMRTACTTRAAGRACSPCALVTTKAAVSVSGPTPTVSGPGRSPRPGVGAPRCDALPARAPQASAATSSRSAPAAAATAATIRPSTRGAGQSSTPARACSSSRSSASSADSTALPRSISTTTPVPESALVIASRIWAASVPNVVSSRPAAISMGSGGRAAFPARVGPRRGPVRGCARRRRSRPAGCHRAAPCPSAQRRRGRGPAAGP